MTFISRYLAALCVMAATVATGPVLAGVVISGTRVVYAAQDREVTVKLSNDGSKPALLQTWLDTGDAQASPATVKVPFILSPPMFRMDAGKGQAIRMVYTKEPLASDKETLFWFNVLEVPAQAGGDSNVLQFAFRTRIKVFFRPEKLEGDVNEAADKIQWKLTSAHGKVALVATNPTAYFVSYAQIGVKAGEHLVQSVGSGGMVGPKDSTTFELEGLKEAPAGPVLAQYKWLNDFGGQVVGESPITQ